MRPTVILFLFSTVIIQCNCFLPIISDVISTAQQKIHTRIQEAGSFIGGVSNGIFNAHVSPAPPPSKPSETVIIIVDSHDHRPHNRPHGDRYPPHRPGYNHHGQHPYPQQPEQGNGPSGQNNHNHGGHNQDHPQGPYQPNYPNRPNHPNNGFNPNNRPNPYPGIDYNKPDINGNIDNQDIPKNPNQGDQNNQSHPNNNSNKPNDGNVITVPPSKATTEAKDDSPFFVPLNPADIGDQTDSTAPKRDTDNTKPAEDDDELFPIDIRLKQ